MPLLINLRQLEKKDLTLQGELTPTELELEHLDEMIHVKKPLEYDLEVEQIDDAILVQGSLLLELECECVRCLKTFKQEMDLPDWAAHLPLVGEEKVVISNDTIDLTPYIREDIVLGFPQHPLCSADCSGLPKGAAAKLKKISGAGKFDESSSAWTQLDKLKLK
ncbi:MAG: hypothetical protein JWM68_4770 [Verrucomicrobiales bacterium]|nr:hypothetical protein [Verrucomicrobiales bacterium]